PADIRRPAAPTVAGPPPAAGTATAAASIDFNRKIRPLLSDRCFACHGPDAEHRQADLRLDREQDAKQSAIVPGQPGASELIARITSSDDETRMPPPDSSKSLSGAEKELMRRWIAEGAHWSAHWAYEPPRRHPIPAVVDGAWPANWIDHFLLARWEAERMRPSPDADRVTLIRRLCFDLLGLPPSPGDVERFLADASPQAYESLVDRLLESPRFGERLAMYWLDLVRYADTVGYHGDQEHHISPYRDWVIDAFNDNLPFDQFTRCQLAGDLLPDSTIDDKIASGYNRLLQTSHEGGVQAKEYLAIYAADRVRNASAVWLGGTMGCCQCHDHKFDPYTMRDFYSLAAFFADVDEAHHLTNGADRTPTMRKPELLVHSRRERQRLVEIQVEITDVERQLETADPPQAAALRQRLDTLQQQQQSLQKAARLTMITAAIPPRTMRVLPRGNWLDDSGPVVQPAVPEFLGRVPVEGRPANRLDLANWLTDDQQGIAGLTARVQVNRFWYLLFGAGLAPVLDDFGGQGQPPEHAELLDQLAREFVDSGWNVKRTLKLIVMSRAYRQSSLESAERRERDPSNRLFVRQARFRLPAEMIRDNALAISGLLVEQSGGPSVRPYQPDGYYRHLNFPPRTYQHDTDQRQWRRGVYMHWQRQFLHPMLRALDAPSREECTAQRPRSNTPLAALTLLNDPTFVEAARVLAERILLEGGDTPDAKFDLLFRLAASRSPDNTERAVLAELLASAQREYADRPAEAAQLVTTGQAPRAKDLEPVDLAAWTAVARAVLNLSETNTRN
ncbi:MAG: DUF1553 domain-containing protein, partial [Pirellulaceae bacterium]|nr:DUF1553 domain-containing protein [Pirellulaceae bacterium]